MAYMSIVPAASLRASASHRSELVSQLLFGELCEVLDEEKEFVKVSCKYEGYEGWCQRSQLIDYGADNYAHPISYVSTFTAEVLLNDESCIIPMGAVIEKRELPGFTVGAYSILHFAAAGNLPAMEDYDAALMESYARRYLGVSYLWGGKSVFGIDCSGFAQQVFKMLGIWLPRDAYQQAEIGEQVGFLQEVKPGDLAFFDNEEGRITHVGILLNDHTIIHSSGNVRIDRIDHAGIINSVTGKRTHRLRLIKSIVN